MTTVTAAHCAQALRHKLRHDHFSIVNYRLEHNEHFLGFCSTHAKLIITVKVRGKDETYGFFVKTSCEKPELNDKFWRVQKMFLKEYLVRDKLIPDLSKQAVDKITAEMYCGDGESFIILEDLNCLGHEVCRKKSPDLEHARVGVKSLANLHASSIFLQQNTNESLKTLYKDVFFETVLVFPNGRNAPCLLYSVSEQLRLLANQLIDKIDGETKSKIIDKATDRILNFGQPSKKHLNLVCHGDAWGNNLLYKYDNKGKPTGALLVDFQVVRYAPPAIDIAHYLYTSFSSEFRTLHFNDLTKVYYDALSDYLLKRNIDIDSILTESAFLESVEDYKEFGILIKAFYVMTRLPVESLDMLTESQKNYLDALIYGETAVFDHAFNITKDYKIDVIESLQELFDFYLNKSD